MRNIYELLSRVVPDLTSIYAGEPCWRWLRQIDDCGYGNARWYGDGWKAHRAVYSHERGPIPAGLVLDHLCRNRWCVNPWHLEAVTNWVNVSRSDAPSALNARKTHCPQGHPYSSWRIAAGSRRCRECTYQRRRDWVARNRKQFNARRRELYAAGRNA